MPVLMVGLLAAAPVGAQSVGIDNPDSSTPTTMYFHLHAQQDFPINTQPPDDQFAGAEDVGLMGHTTTCLPDPTGQLGMVRQGFHTLYGFSTPGYVEYAFAERGGPRVHPERGLAKDVELDVSAPATLYWYLETKVVGDSRSTPADTEAAPVIVPEVTVEVTVRQGDDVGVGDAAYNQGGLIGHGASEPMLVAPDDANPHYHELPDGRHLYEFVVPIDLSAEVITKDEAFNIRIDTYVAVPGCDSSPDETLMTSNMRVHTSPEFRPRLDWSITNPVQIEFIHPQFVGEDLVIHTALSSPWGNYDVDESPEGVQVSIEGPSEARSLTRTAFVQRHHEHGHHFQPVDVSFSWPYRLDEAEKGDYVIEVRVRNDQGTAEAVGRAGFVLGANVGIDAEGNRVERVERPDAVDTPLPGTLLALGVVGAAWALRRGGRP